MKQYKNEDDKESTKQYKNEDDLQNNTEMKMIHETIQK